MKSQAREIRWSAFVVAVGFALLSSACASPPPPPAHALETGALALEAAAPRLDEIDCTVENCTHWYRVDIASKGSLRLSVETFEPAAEDAESGSKGSFLGGGGGEPKKDAPFELTIADSLGVPLGSIDGVGYERLAFDARVARGSYLVSVRTADVESRFGYRLRYEFKPEPKKKPVVAPKPPPKPRFEKRAATILEFEGWGSDVEAVLIDLGSNHGMKQGQTGYFVQEGEQVGKIVIEQVYPEGSRAKVEGALDRPLGSNASVVILIPLR